MVSMLSDDTLHKFLATINKIDVCDPDDPAAIDSLLLEVIQTNLSDASVQHVASLVADSCRDPQRRKRFGTPALKALSDIYQQDTHQPSQMHELQRAIANIIIDNDDLRSVLLKYPNNISRVMNVIMSENKDLAKSGLGLLINLCTDFDSGKIHLIENDGILLSLNIIKNAPQCASLGLHLLNCLIHLEIGRENFVSQNGIDTLIDTLLTPPIDLGNGAEIIYEILETLSDGDAVIQNRLYARNIHHHLLNFLEDQINMTINMCEEQSQFLDCAMNILVNITGNDHVSEQMVNDKAVLKKLHSWFTYSDDILNAHAADFITCSSLCLGNLSCSDKSSVLLVKEYNFACHLIRVLQVVRNAKVQLAALQVLRHLSIPVENKNILCQMGITEAVGRYMLSPVPDVSLTAIGIHRLLSGQDRNMRTVIQFESGNPPTSSLETAIEAWSMHSDHAAIQCEVGRLIAILVKTAVAADAKACIEILQNNTILSPVWHLLTLPYKAVYPEAVLALTLLLSKGNDPASIHIPEALASSAPSLFSSDIQLEFCTNAAQMLILVQFLHSEWKGRFDEVRHVLSHRLKEVDPGNERHVLNLQTLLTNIS